MRKITLLLVALSATLFINAQIDTVFQETFDGITSKIKPAAWADASFDNAGTCTFTGANVDIRSTSTLSPHVWFPTGKNDTLKISGIPGGINLTLSFDIASNGAKDTASLITIHANEEKVVVPDSAITEQNKYVHVSGINIADAENINLVFAIPSNVTHGGIRIDNIIIESSKSVTTVENTEIMDLNAFVANDILYLNAEDGAAIRMYSVNGALVLNSFVNNGQVALNGLNHGIYVVNVNNHVAKVTVR